eukprot:TRINITY_DN18367_c0_g2_i1.p2 TRINITY_DN18367_c0_g2~~TRINITY_DN18367_c0_g2_i1.p2  ORF type:complete len:126 (-),score=2.43 TRINITY_DN18367_c0_g2_i1:236-568(-)
MAYADPDFLATVMLYNFMLYFTEIQYCITQFKKSCVIVFEMIKFKFFVATQIYHNIFRGFYPCHLFVDHEAVQIVAQKLYMSRMLLSKSPQKCVTKKKMFQKLSRNCKRE